MELYIHIPFCIQKCGYCDFMSAPATKQVQNAYMEALLGEIRSADVTDNIITSVFIGGGTPSAVDSAWIPRLMDTVRRKFTLAGDAEISMEVNPGTVTRESLELYRKAGVNRLSIGCQSADDGELARIGRIHSFSQFLDTYRWAREAGFANINVDLMSALPGQSMEDWERTLEKILALDPIPEHISAYSLIVEEGTAFHEQYKAGQLVLPDEDTEREMYWKTAEILQNSGYEHYEISNYARNGYICRHNCGYWQRANYLGFGIGAASLYQNIRFRNTDSLAEYLEALAHGSMPGRLDIQQLSVEDQMAETFILGLRMMEGVDLQEFKETYGKTAEEVYGNVIRESIEEGLLERRKSRLVLTKRGIDISNYIMAKFI